VAKAKSSSSNSVKKINLALQGGGAHGAFAWGVIDKLLEDGRIEIEGVSGTSAGSMNAVVYAYGAIHGPEAAREALHNFWKAISDAGERYSPIKRSPIEKLMQGHNLETTWPQISSKWSHSLSLLISSTPLTSTHSKKC